MMKAKVTKSSGHVYTDLGFDTGEAENRRVRGVLMMEIERYIRRRGLKQAEAAKHFGVKQPEISHLLNRNIDRFSIDKLMNMVRHVGKEIRIRVQGDKILITIQPAKPSPKTRRAKTARTRPTHAAA